MCVLRYVMILFVPVVLFGCAITPKGVTVSNGVSVSFEEEILFPTPTGMRTAGDDAMEYLLVKGQQVRGRRNKGVAMFFNENDDVLSSFLNSQKANDPVEKAKIMYEGYTGAFLVDYLSYGEVGRSKFEEFKRDLAEIHKSKYEDSSGMSESRNRKFKNHTYKFDVDFDTQKESVSGNDYYTYFYIRNGTVKWDGIEYEQNQIVAFTMFRLQNKVFEMRGLQNYRSPEDRLKVQERTARYIQRLGLN